MIGYPLFPGGEGAYIPSNHSFVLESQELEASGIRPSQKMKKSSSAAKASLQDKRIGLPAPNQDDHEAKINQLEAEIKQDFERLAQLNDDFEHLEEAAQKSSKSNTVSMLVQYWVSDVVLKGGAAAAQSGLPFLMNTTSDALDGLLPATSIISGLTDVLDLGTGVATIIYKSQILKTAQQELNALKQREPPLDPIQIDRLKQLEKMIKYEKGLLESQMAEQGVRVFKNIFSHSSTVIYFVGTTPAALELASLGNTLVGGVNAALFGLYFYRAHQHHKAHDQWSNAFKRWVENQTVVIDKIESADPAVQKKIKAQASEILKKRQERHDHQVQLQKTLKEKIQRKEIDIDDIRKKVVQFKQPPFHRFLLSLNFQDVTIKEFQGLLEERLGTPMKLKTCIGFRNALLTAEKLKSSNTPLPADLKLVIERYESICLNEQIDKLDEDTILSSYIEYHSVLDPTLKHALSKMVKKKHEIESEILKTRRNHMGWRFTAATVVFAVALALAIVALAATPVGAAALIIAILTVGSLLLTAGLLAASTYQLYQLKPRQTVAMFKGAYIAVYYYQTRALLSSLKEKIAGFVKSVWQAKRDRNAQVISLLPSVSNLNSSNLDEEKDAILRLEIKKKRLIDEQKHFAQSEYWRLRAEIASEELEKISWEDFAEKAHLQIDDKQKSKDAPESQSFDTLKTLNDLLTHCDFSLLSAETRELIEIQFGISIDTLQQMIETDPSAVKKMVRTFFNMSTDAFIQFVGLQRTQQLSQSEVVS